MELLSATVSCESLSNDKLANRHSGGRIPRRRNPVHTFTTRFFTVNFNIILLSFHTKISYIYIYISHICHACYMSRPFRSPLLYRPNTVFFLKKKKKGTVLRHFIMPFSGYKFHVLYTRTEQTDIVSYFNAI